MRRALTLVLSLLLALAVAGCNPNRGDDGGGGQAGGDTDVKLMLPFQKGLSFWSSMLPEELGSTVTFRPSASQ